VDVEADCLELDSWADVGDALARELAGALRGVRACQLHQPVAMNTKDSLGRERAPLRRHQSGSRRAPAGRKARARHRLEEAGVERRCRGFRGSREASLR